MKILIKLLGAIASFPFAMFVFLVSLFNIIPMTISRLLIGDFNILKENKENFIFIYEIYKHSFKPDTLVQITSGKVLFVNGKITKRITKLTKL